MRSLRLCMIAPDFIPVWSGVGSYRIELVKHLPRDIELHILTTRRMIPSKTSSTPARDELALKRLNRDIHVHAVSSAHDTFLYHGNFQYACFRNLPRLQKKFRFNLIHTDFPLMSDILVQLFSKMRVRTISSVHTTIQGQSLGVRYAEKRLSKLPQSDLANLLLLLPLELCEYLYLRRVPYFIATSNYAKMELQKYFPFVANKYLPVIQYGVDTELFSPSSAPRGKDLQDISSLDRPVVLFTGRLVASKGIYTLIRAIPMILQANPSAVFLFVGGGDSRQYAQELKSRGVPEENFRFLGYVDYFDMPQVYSLAKVFVVPSLYEGLPLRVLEAMSCERTTVATQVCGIPEIVEQGRNGILVPPNNHEELARNIVVLLEDDSFAKKLGKRARETVLKKFSASQMASKTLDVYRRCVDGGH